MELKDVRLTDSDYTGKSGPKDKTRQRILRTADFIRQGNSRTKTIEMLRSVEGMSETQAKRVYAATIKYLTPTEEELGDMKFEIMETLREVITEGIKKGDKTATVKALDILNKMLGNYTEKIDANISGDMNFGFNFGEADAEDGEENN